MARTAASKAEQAATALDAYLRDRPRPVAGDAALAPQGTDALELAPIAPAGPIPSQPDPGSARTTEPDPPAGAPLWLPHTDWLHHRLCVAGPVLELDGFRQAASGAGTIPWQLDLDTLEEDWFHLLANPASRELSLTGIRMLAAQLREAVERRHALAAARVGRSRACLFDLHALVPVPSPILRLGPDHPEALAWLWQHWGTTEALRHVAPQRAGKDTAGLVVPAGEGVLRLSFWSADWTPWRAFARIRDSWPALRFDVQPDYAAA